MAISAKVVKDSLAGRTRLITLEIELHRFVLPEFNTHRMISRNFQSSRAVPIKNMIEQVRNNPALPVHIGRNQAGMVAEKELTGGEYTSALFLWRDSARKAADQAEAMDRLGVHKQLVNRVLEPFMWTRGVVTATEESWEAFLRLRLHKDAQPEIYALAEKIKEAIDNSTPEQLKVGEWHVPYVPRETIEEIGLENAIKVSASCCAQVSYRRLDDSVEKAIKVYDMLNLPENGKYPDDPPHFSPTEHIAVMCEGTGDDLSGNFHSDDLFQYRKLLEYGLEKEVING